MIDHTINFYKNKLYIFGGCDGKKEFGELYKIKLQKKEIKSVDAKGDVPSPRHGHSADIYRDFLYVFGGWDGIKTLNDLYQYSFSKKNNFV